jgi:Cytochrome c oxidase subunit IV
VTEPSGRPVPGTEGPRGHELDAPVDDRKVPWRVFLTIGTLVLVLGAIYWATAYEESGTVMLLLAGALSLWIGAYLWLRIREETGPERDAASEIGEQAAAVGAGPPGHGVAEEGEYYLPHASAWPFAIGLGAATLANGLVLGLWVIVPGAALMALGIGGFVRQSRRRD